MCARRCSKLPNRQTGTDREGQTGTDKEGQIVADRNKVKNTYILGKCLYLSPALVEASNPPCSLDSEISLVLYRSSSEMDDNRYFFTALKLYHQELMLIL